MTGGALLILSAVGFPVILRIMIGLENHVRNDTNVQSIASTSGTKVTPTNYAAISER